MYAYVCHEYGLIYTWFLCQFDTDRNIPIPANIFSLDFTENVFEVV